MDTRLASTRSSSVGSVFTASVGRMEAQTQSLLQRIGAELIGQSIKQRLQRDVAPTHLDSAGVEPRDVEQLVKQAIERTDRIADAAHQVPTLGIADDVAQRRGEQAERMQWLAQVVAGRGEEARLGDIGLLGGRTGSFDLLDSSMQLDIRRSHAQFEITIQHLEFGDRPCGSAPAAASPRTARRAAPEYGPSTSQSSDGGSIDSVKSPYRDSDAQCTHCQTWSPVTVRSCIA